MFSLQRINAKLNLQDKLKAERRKSHEKKSDAFLSLVSSESKYTSASSSKQPVKKEVSISDTIKKNKSKKNKSSRYFSKLNSELAEDKSQDDQMANVTMDFVGRKDQEEDFMLNKSLDTILKKSKRKLRQHKTKMKLQNRNKSMDPAYFKTGIQNGDDQSHETNEMGNSMPKVTTSKSLDSIAPKLISHNDDDESKLEYVNSRGPGKKGKHSSRHTNDYGKELQDWYQSENISNKFKDNAPNRLSINDNSMTDNEFTMNDNLMTDSEFTMNDNSMMDNEFTMNDNSMKDQEFTKFESSEENILTSRNFRPTPYLSIKRIDEDTVLLALHPNSTVPLVGYYWLKLVIGTVSVLGYTFSEGEKRAVFSPSSHCISPIEALKGRYLKKNEFKKLGFPKQWLKSVFGIEKTPVIIELKRYTSTLTSFLHEIKAIPIIGDVEMNDLNGLMLSVNCEHSTKARNFIPNEAWADFVDQLQHESKKSFCIMVTGGQGLGKSTLLRYMVNRFLNMETVEEVAVLDLDPGQPEFSLPGTLTLVRLKSPLLGPSITHREKVQFTHSTNVFFGDSNVQSLLQEYFEVITRLTKESKQISSPKVPLIVNTMGYTKNLGLDIMVDAIRIVQPTHIVTIESKEPSYNFSERLSPEFITTCNNGIVTKGKGIETDFELSSFGVVGDIVRFDGNTQKPATFNRNLNVLSYLSKLWCDTSGLFTSSTCKTAVKIEFESVGIHSFGSMVPASHILQAINGTLVCLCHIKEEHLETVGLGLPKQIRTNSDWLKTNVCHGWGVVRGIEPLHKQIHVLTPMESVEVDALVNAIILPNVELPDQFFKLFSQGVLNAPYQLSKRTNMTPSKKKRKTFTP